MTVQLRDYQQKWIADIRASFGAGNRAVLGVLPTGAGKCLGRGTPVLRYNGTITPVERVQVGELLMGPDSTPRRVLSLARGREQMWKVVPKKGTPFVCNESHILTIKMTKGSKKTTGLADGTVLDLSVADYLRTTKSFKHCAKLFRVGVDFASHPELCLLDPYILGLWLGDGASKGASITTGDDEIKDAWIAYASQLGLGVRTEQNSKNSQNFHMAHLGTHGQGRGHRTNSFLARLHHYGLLNNKHIPERYKTGSLDERRALLAGLIDTDGYYHHGYYDVTLANKRLVEDAAFIARSIGLAAYISPRTKKCHNNGVVGQYWSLSISGDVDQIPCRIPRKKATPRRQIKDALVTGFSLQKLQEDDYFGFTLEGSGHFLLGDFTVTHNTVGFSYISAGIYRKNKRVWVMAHRRELLRQISESLALFQIPHAVLSGGYHGVPNAPVLVASVFTLVNRIKHMQAPHLIIGDEAHHFTLASSWGKIVTAFPAAKVLGVTASPARLDGKGLGDVFNSMVMGPTVAELTARGFLSPAVVYAPAKPDLSGLKRRAGDYVTGELEDIMDKPKITGSAVKHYQRYADGKRAVAFCVSVAHAEHTAEQFRAAGYVAAHVDGKMDDRLRDQTIAAFKRGQINVLTSCDLINEGFDVPGIECAILLRPTQSLTLYMQQCGRAIRPSPGKTHTIILDHAGNTAMHGFIDEVRDWTLDGSVHRQRDSERAAPVRTCPKCFCMHRPAPTCPRCEYVYPANGREVEHVDGDLELQGDGTAVPPAVDPERLEQKIEVLVALGRRRGMKKPREWAFHVLCGQLAAKRAQERDVPHQNLINGLTEMERNEIWAKVKEVAA